MIPQLSPGSNLPACVPPRPGFKAPVGTICDIWIDWSKCVPGFGASAAQAAGLKYEAKVHDYLESVHHSYAASPRLWYTDDAGRRYVVPDGIFPLDGVWREPKFLVLVEIKVRHMPEAWWQLKRLYEPILRVHRPNIPIYCLEVVSSYDPAMPFPCRVNLIRDLKGWLDAPTAEFTVLEWKP